LLDHIRIVHIEASPGTYIFRRLVENRFYGRSDYAQVLVFIIAATYKVKIVNALDECIDLGDPEVIVLYSFKGGVKGSVGTVNQLGRIVEDLCHRRNAQKQGANQYKNYFREPVYHWFFLSNAIIALPNVLSNLF